MGQLSWNVVVSHIIRTELLGYKSNIQQGWVWIQAQRQKFDLTID